MAMRNTCIFTTFISFLLMSSSTALAEDKSYLARGSSISTGDETTAILVSPNGAFTCGFYKVATNAFTFSIWFSWATDKAVAWTANRDAPVNGKGSRLIFQKDGALALLDYNGTVVWSTNTTASRSSRAMLLNSGNLVVMDTDGHHLWRSFNSPTDTLLPMQPMTRNTKLVSASARGLLYSGMYAFYFASNNILTLIYNGPETSSIYWPDPYYVPWDTGMSTYNSTRYGVLDQTGRFVASDQLEFEASDLGDEIMRRFTLDYDGNLRLYSLNIASGNWSISWMAFPQPCKIHGLCSANNLCRYRPELESCSCLEGFEMIEPGDWSKGCRRKTNTTPNQEFSFRKLTGTDLWGYDFNYSELYPWWMCRDMCLNNTDCLAFGYRKGTGECYPKVFLFNGRNFPDPYNDINLRVPKAVSSSPELADGLIHGCKVTEREAYPSSQMFVGGNSSFRFGYFISSALTLLVIEVTLIMVGYWVVYKLERRPEIMDEGYMIISSQFQRFSYDELQKATKCFQEELGSGASGVVYKGVLDDGRKVAVKKLNDVMQGEQEFRSELSVIGRIYHMNLVRIWGVCAEQTQKLLVSEFVENGSLDKFLIDYQDINYVLQWSQRYNIALGVAKGLAYLHHEWIIHCDVKPENILLDEEYEPKIADFGLAKVLNRGAGAQMLSRVHGTRGYIAPEWALNLPITGKADVYSYGIVLLKLVKGVRASSWVIEHEEEVEMPIRCTAEVLKDKLVTKDLSWLLEFVDCRLDGEFNYLQAAIMLKIAVSCMEEERNKRPSMSHVLETLLSLVE
ncbi:hypothetical protein BS78_10G054700 [Paspalum vaginatum]|nr:hypothetical protein BS78_10G054700 [Paspalum vaginatum]